MFVPAHGKPQALILYRLGAAAYRLGAAALRFGIRHCCQLLAVTDLGKVDCSPFSCPSGKMSVKGVAKNPKYSYRPDKNFQQSDDEPLTLPPGPNGPVGSIWIDLTKETYGIHGTAEPALVGKTSSHGCVRLTNWDAEELGSIVKFGTKVSFLE